MRISVNILSLPPALLLLLSTLSWPAGAYQESVPKRAAHAKYWPEHEVLARRDARIQMKLATARPVGVRKMSEDEGEKFFLHYWQFDGQQAGHEPYFDAPISNGGAALKTPELSHLRSAEYNKEAYANASILALLPPFLQHLDQSHTYEGNLRFFRRAALQKRDYQCPAGTSACTQINRPNICCASGQTCVLVTDTGLGDVGCCPAGTACGGQVSSCDTAKGYHNCPGSPNGGCCIPGFTCQGIGCVISNTLTVTTTRVYTITLVHTTETVVVTGSTSTVLIATTTILTLTPNNVIPAATSTTIVSNPSPAITTTITTVSPAPAGTLTCSTGYQSCPASMGGGCCRTDRACGATECPALPTAAPPVRPTSDSQSIASTATEANTITTAAATTQQQQSSVTGTVCPTGYYMCSAYYLGGCCRVGRNCDTTSCPPGETTTVVSSGVVIIVTSVGEVGVQSISSSFSSSTAARGLSTTTAPSPSTSTTTVRTQTQAPSATITTAAQLGQGACANGWYNCDTNQGGGCCPSGFACGPSCTATVQGVGTGTVAKIAPASGGVRVSRGLGWGFLGFVGFVGVGMVML